VVSVVAVAVAVSVCVSVSVVVDTTHPSRELVAAEADGMNPNR